MGILSARLSYVFAGVMLFCLAPQQACAEKALPSDKEWEAATKLMPQEQKDTIVRMKQIEERRNSANEEAEPKKSRLFAEIRKELDALNKKVAEEGVKDWIGKAVVIEPIPGKLVFFIDFGRDAAAEEERHMTMSLEQMPDKPLSTVGRLTKGSEWVRFTLAPDAKKPLVFHASGKLIGGEAAGRTLTDITKVSINGDPQKN